MPFELQQKHQNTMHTQGHHPGQLQYQNNIQTHIHSNHCQQTRPSQPSTAGVGYPCLSSPSALAFRKHKRNSSDPTGGYGRRSCNGDGTSGFLDLFLNACLDLKPVPSSWISPPSSVVNASSSLPVDHSESRSPTFRKPSICHAKQTKNDDVLPESPGSWQLRSANVETPGGWYSKLPGVDLISSSRIDKGVATSIPVEEQVREDKLEEDGKQQLSEESTDFVRRSGGSNICEVPPEVSIIEPASTACLISCLQPFASPLLVLVSLCAMVFTQSMVVSGYLSSIYTTLERRYGLSSRQIGMISSSYEVSSTSYVSFTFIPIINFPSNR
ncbi:unnamed protein product [Protopolystoma xenopodis]|uniref:Major facilitator superfamily (MFS) profile domain-containing protein n=1 Tax=Protopolystoma xenopodis TaxID=117903 RepID=A0A3S5CPG6_9PLAT|nr:unnamed protein product [Protopolystoma xenopodis]